MKASGKNLSIHVEYRIKPHLEKMQLYVWPNGDLDCAWTAELGPMPTREDDARLEAELDARDD